MSVNEYICNTILAETELILSTRNISILELSHKFGFSDQFYFSRKFKEKFGVSPREYRNRLSGYNK
jgi:AraC-like DNA-binding protein